MTFDRTNVLGVNLLSEGTTATAQFYTLNYAGPLTDFTDSGQAQTQLKAYFQKIGIDCFDILWIRSTTATSDTDAILYAYVTNFSDTIQVLTPLSSSSAARRTFFAGTFANRTALNTWGTNNLGSLYNSNVQVTVANVTTPAEQLEWVGLNQPTSYNANAWQTRHSSTLTPRTDEDIRRVSYAGFTAQGEMNIEIPADSSSATFQSDVLSAGVAVILYIGVSTSNNADTIPISSLTMANTIIRSNTNVERNAPTVDFTIPALTSTAANSYFMIFIRSVYTITKMANPPSFDDILNQFPNTGTRVIESIPYAHYVSGPIRNGITLTPTLTIQGPVL